MKILHTADWHLGKKLENVDRLEEQKAVLAEICRIADEKEVDAVLIAGDLFDTFNPPTEATEVFYRTLKQLAKDGQRAVFAIAGNHDSPDRIEAPDALARECGIFFAGYPNTQIRPIHLESGLQITQADEGFLQCYLPGYSYPLRLLITPYANEYRLKSFLGIDNPDKALEEVVRNQWQSLADQYLDEKGVNMLMTHLFMVQKGQEIPEEPEGEKPIHHVGGASEIHSESVPDAIQYTALGHLHSLRELDGSGGPAVYSSSPLAYSFAEAGQQKYVVILEAETGKEVSPEYIPLKEGKPLVRKKIEGVDGACEWLHQNPDCLVELTLITDDFISAQDRKKLHNAHSGIITLIPEVKQGDQEAKDQASTIDLQKDMTELFRDYFAYKQGQNPDETMMNLFREILSAGEENDDEKDNRKE